MPVTAPADIPLDFAREFDSERALLLRRRAAWYCVVFLSLLAALITHELTGPASHDTPSTQQTVELPAYAALAVLYSAGLVYFVFARPNRPRIVAAATALMVAAGAVVILTTPLRDNSAILEGARPEGTRSAAYQQGLATLFAVFLLHVVASLLIALSPREGLRVLLPLLGLFAAATLLSDARSGDKVVLLALSPLAGLPGFAWSWWRHRSFSERFTTRQLAGRYAEVSRELSDARRLHEALFPPPLTRGPKGGVRIDYRYQPMSQIGGDFLFIHPLAFPPSVPEGPISLVILDVTGHGIAAAIAVNRLHAELNRLFGAEPVPHPGDVLTDLNAFVRAHLAEQGVFATGVCLRIDPRPDGDGDHSHALVEFASAGHPAAILLRPAHAPSRLPATAPMLGVLDPSRFKALPVSFHLDPDATLLIYTDGVVEAESDDGAHFGVETLEKLAASAAEAHAASADAPSVLDAVSTALESHRPGPRRDDTLLVAVRIAGSDEPSP